MEIKVKDIVLARTVLEELSERNLPARTSFKIALLVKKVLPILQTFEEQRNNIIVKLGQKSEDGTYVVPPERMPEANKYLGDIGEEIVEIDFTPIDISLLGDIEIKPAHLLLLDPFLDQQL